MPRVWHKLPTGELKKIIIVIEFIERGVIISTDLLFCQRALLEQHGFTLARGWPLSFGHDGVKYLQQEITTLKHFGTNVPKMKA